MATEKRMMFVDVFKKNLCHYCNTYMSDEPCEPGECWVHYVIAQTDTVDAVEVVRCKDCAKDGLFTCPICFIENKTLHFINHSPDFYCGEGERKDGEGNG